MSGSGSASGGRDTSAAATGFAAELHGVARARAVVERLLADNGCAWHLEQTHESLSKYLQEEAAETVDAIIDGDPAKIAEELGDVLYQVLFHTELARKNGETYSFDTVAERLAEKLIARHPHVFETGEQLTSAELTEMWQQLKLRADRKLASGGGISF
ncbi:hypothetical protein KJY77_03900 [Canibacter sp. lx-72]|nr:hypothetical protein [Canibacter zhuwentaonis]MBT1035291.1 hypothetical protein [Canibacter zhuwentaonis]